MGRAVLHTSNIQGVQGKKRGMVLFRFFLMASEILCGGTLPLFALLPLGWHSHWLWCRTYTSVFGSVLWSLKAGHLSACEPAPFLQEALLRLEFVCCSPLGICSVKEGTFRKFCPPKSAFENGRPCSLPDLQLICLGLGDSLGGAVWRESLE